MKSFKTSQWLSLLVAAAFCIIAPIMGYIKIGLPPIIIIGGAALIGFIFWYFTYFKEPTDPKIILPLFVLTVAALQIHIIEEYVTGFGPAMSRLFNIPWSERSFIMVFALVGPTIYTLTTLGLYYRIRLAGFVAWFIFIGPGVAEFTHFIFPLLQPHLEPDNINAITRTINGSEIANMPNYYVKTTAEYYFSGMYTAILPMIPGIYAIFRLTKAHRMNKQD
ncbi:hypothetical protein [Flavobacterium wongokense]|uniref:hypothetical protein n=1 Tax=Flavobacterium wongokense TaxID=2910674 RepID=UPI001F22BADC|nr:hypothetical protein [Flavobacterium sp. WG47]MCF6133151.1 hypothetical protein [Flavobacterium sp. WG47]